ncbi:MAG: hypothetical protein ABI541_07415 [Betaproteobacteria bacterium]
MNAMLEAKIVAAKIHGAATGGQGESHREARMTPVSEGDAGKPVTARQDRAKRATS